MHHFRVEHGGVVAAALVGGDGEGRILRRRDDFKTLGEFGDPVTVAHPDGIASADVPEALEQRARRLHLEIGTAELRRMAALDDAAELGAERLLAIADAEDRDSGVEDRLWRPRAAFRRHRGRTAGEDHALRLHLLEGRSGVLERVDLAIDPGFADAARNQLRHLAAEIDDQDGVGVLERHGWPIGSARRAVKGA